MSRTGRPATSESNRTTFFGMLLRPEEYEALVRAAEAQGKTKVAVIREGLPEIFGSDLGIKPRGQGPAFGKGWPSTPSGPRLVQK